MRVKIKGEITAERLSEALQAASEKCEMVRPGHKIYGANLYLTAYDANGLPFDLTDYRGESISITIEAKSGELVRPALTGEGEKRRQEANEEARRLKSEAAAVEEAAAAAAAAEAAAEYEQRLEKYKLECQKRQENEAQARQHFETMNVLTAELMKTMPERFVDELNKIVQGVWHDFKPVEPHGKYKGQPKPPPVFSTHAGGLLLSCETWKNPLRVLNPIFKIQNGELVSFWKYDAWAEAMNRIADTISALAESVPTPPEDA